jgi:tetratricopeptide (TPR) repeat protein
MEYYERGLALSEQGKYDEVIAEFTKAIDLNPKYVEAYYNRGTAYLRTGQHDLAISDCTKAIELDPKYALAYNTRGNAYFEKKQYDEAIADYTIAIELDHKDAKAYHNRGYTYGAKGEFDNAIADFTKATELDPKNAYGFYYRGNAYYLKMQYDNAIADFTKCIELDPKYALAYNTRGNAYYLGKNQYDKAKADFTKAIELDPRYAQAYYNRGNVYSWNNQYDEAIADYTKAIELDPKYAKAYYNRGNAYYSGKNQYEEAVFDFRKVIELSNDSVSIDAAKKALGLMGYAPIVSPTPTPTLESKAGWIIVERSDENFVFSLPETWKNVVLTSTDKLMGFLLFSYDPAPHPKTARQQGSFSVVKQVLGKPVIFNDFISFQLQSLEGNSDVVKPVVHELVQLLIGEAVQFRYQRNITRDGGQVETIVFIQYMYLMGNDCYIFTFETYVDLIEKYTPIFKEIAYSFRFVK